MILLGPTDIDLTILKLMINVIEILTYRYKLL